MYRGISLDTFTYKTRGVCSREITISINEGRLEKVSFRSGCNGNLKGISKLVEGMTVQEVIARLKGIDCDGKGTSCPDQLATALQEYLQK
jgi:uncharacterized protein (TIGR03905 family)